jgi:RNA polymerase primary sigma factor
VGTPPAATVTAAGGGRGKANMGKSKTVGRTGRTARAEENLLALYLKDINRVPLLTRKEEETLARQVAQGSQVAKEKLVQANLRFVVNTAKKYQHKGLPLEDLISEGNIGLLYAIERFDVEKGYHFISYAVWWIRQAILNALSEKSRMIRLPTNRTLELSQIQRELDGRRALPGREANLLNIARPPLSLDAPSGPQDDSAPFGDTVEDKESVRLEELAVTSSLRDDINQVLGSLEKKEAEIIQYRFGLNGKRPHSLRELGTRYKLTKERIRQIEKRALRELQNPVRNEQLRAYI